MNGTTDQDMKSGILSSINWDAFMPAIKDFVRLREDEVIAGILVSEIGLKVKIDRKRRKYTRKEQTETSI